MSLFKIRRMGCDSKHDSSFSINRPCGYDCFLVLYVKTNAIFEINNNVINTEPNTFIIFNKKSAHKYRAAGEEYINHWIQLECSESFSAELNAILDKPIFVGNSVDIDGYMRLINDVYIRSNERVYSHLLYAMLEDVCAIGSQPYMQTAHFAKLVSLRKDIYSHPEEKWTVKLMSEQINISEPYLQALYREAFGVSCNADVINSRIDTAKNLLSDTDLNVNEIAQRCGYSSTVHFSRQFKQLTGITPSEFRK